MMELNAGDQLPDPAWVRDQLDEILAGEITALLDVDTDSAMMSFNLVNISCITLIIEREREIKQYSDFPPERYTRKSFLDELADIGLETGQSLEQAVDSVIGQGYISVDERGELRAEMPAFMMIGFLDNMFPGMQGMNLIAFILQMNDEVLSGRKKLETAKEAFKSTLKSRGVAVSIEKAEKKASEIVSGAGGRSGRSREISRQLKRDNLDRLSRLVRTRKKRTLDAGSPLNVTSVFDKGLRPEEQAEEKAEIRKAQEEAAREAAELARELAEKQERIKEAEASAREAARQLEEIEQREKKLLEAQAEAEQARLKIEELKAREAMMAQKEEELRALEEKLKQDEKLQQQEETLRQEAARTRSSMDIQEPDASDGAESEDTILSDEDIESRIAALENELTMPCPLCGKGEVVTRTTEKGKEYYTCTHPSCRFVSWEKPYHLECPLCKNAFLVETVTSTGEKGLKCPRASCSYRQGNLLDPRQSMAQAATATGVKKVRKVIRRKRH